MYAAKSGWGRGMERDRYLCFCEWEMDGVYVMKVVK